jgi:periplasmic divalent cation tolerance protein
MSERPNTQIYFVYVTTSGRDEAARIASTLVGERLAACANTIPGMTSTYWWDGSVQTNEECVVILKTAADRLAALRRRITEIHSYDLPCVVAMEITDSSPEYREWVVAETRVKPVVNSAGD